MPTLQVQDLDPTSWKIGEKYSEIINPSRHFLIIKNNNNFIQIFRRQFFELRNQDKLLGILSAGRMIKSITINAISPLPNSLRSIIKPDNIIPVSPSEKYERGGFDSTLWPMDILFAFQIASILVQQENNSLSNSSSHDEPLITEIIISDTFRKTLEDVWQDILLNQKRFNGKNNTSIEGNLDFTIKQFKNQAREVCRSGLVLNSLKFIIDLDQILITNLRLTNSNPLNSLLSENDGSLKKSPDIEKDKTALIRQHRDLLENSFPKTSDKFTNQELL